jgi:hypothetical protein
MKNIFFIHGLESSGKGFKGTFLKKLLPDILTPYFKKFEKNISLESLLKDRKGLSELILEKKNS